MIAPGGGGREDRRLADLLLAASELIYGALLALYPRAFRQRYAEEMRRDFADLSRVGLEEGGGAELMRVRAGRSRTWPSPRFRRGAPCCRGTRTCPWGLGSP